jgi:HSP20 family protein
MADTIITTRATELDRTFDNRVLPANAPKLEWDLAVDIFEQRGNVIAKMILPGMNPDNFDIYLDEDTLRISGRRLEERETKDRFVTQKVVHNTAFSRTVNLPKIVDVTKSSAEYKDGVLQVTMPVYTYTKAPAVKVAIK